MCYGHACTAAQAGKYLQDVSSQTGPFLFSGFTVFFGS